MNLQEIHVVEDDDGHAYLIEKNLRAGCVANRVRRFASGDEFLDHLFEQEGDLPLLVLLDLNMPGTSRYGVLQRLRATARTSNLPVLVLTTTEEPAEIQRCYDLGCSLYLTKPVQREAFIEALQALGFVLQIVGTPEPKASA